MNKVFLQHGPNPIIGNHPAYPRAETAVTPRHHQRKRHSNLHVARFPYSIVIARIGMAKKLIMAAGGILERDGDVAQLRHVPAEAHAVVLAQPFLRHGAGADHGRRQPR